MPDQRLALSITHADGSTTRWGPDEVDGRDIPAGLTFSSSIPGGHKDLSCGLLRDYQLDHPDQALFDTVRVYGPGNRTVWEGRMHQFPARRGDSREIHPGAVGWSAHLEDDPSFREIYVDRDLSHWQGMPLNEQARLAAASTDMGTLSYTVGLGGITCTAANQSTGAASDTSIWYRCPAGVTTQGIQYVGQRTNWPGTWNNPIVRFHLADQYNAGTSETVTPTLDSTLRTAATPTIRATARYASLEVYTGAAATPSAGALERWTKIGVYGNHSLIGVDNGSDPDGFYASDVIADIVSRAAPLLNYTTGAGGTIAPTTFVIPHLAFLDPVTAADAISLVNGFHLYDWAVWDDRTFYWQAPDPDRLCWRARLSDGAHIELEGDDAQKIYNGVLVIYTDPSGERKTAGPTGSDCDVESADLEDTSADNPVNAHGIPKRWAVLSLSSPTTDTGATQIGSVFLAEASQPSRRGTLVLTGTVGHPTMGERPVCEVRAGDWVVLSDRPDDPPRKIIETRYTHDGLQMVCSLDNTVYRLESILERIGVSLVGAI